MKQGDMRAPQRPALEMALELAERKRRLEEYDEDLVACVGWTLHPTQWPWVETWRLG